MADTISRSTGAPFSAMLLASLPPEVNTTMGAITPNGARHLLAGLVQQLPCHAALGMHGGGVAALLHRRQHRRLRLRAQRRGGVMVEVASHAAGLWSGWRSLVCLMVADKCQVALLHDVLEGNR